MDLKQRIGNIIVGYDSLKKPVYVSDLGVEGAMTALLKHAVNPNLVQTIEGTPVFVHGGPFANIAHGCNTLIATRMALKLADYVITEAGFAADLGAEKFFDIKCRVGGLNPGAVVLVVTKRAYDIHGIENIKKHVDNLNLFNIPVCISINKFLDDNDDDISELQKKCNGTGVKSFVTDFREKGGEGGMNLAAEIVDMCAGKSDFKCLYDNELDIKEKIRTVALKIYGAKDVSFSDESNDQIKKIEAIGFKNYPVCMAKTQSSISDNPKLTGCPKDFILKVNSARVSSGAGFIVVYTGKIMTMPGLPRVPSAMNIDIDAGGNISGLF
jgi:formate--tetrahydrofolate ligase